MKLLTKEMEKQFEKIGCQDGNKNPTVIAKFFSIVNGWRWYSTEYIKEDNVFFGMTCGFENELGYFSLGEFEELNRKSICPPIERDINFKVKPLHDALEDDGYSVPEWMTK